MTSFRFGFNLFLIVSVTVALCNGLTSESKQSFSEGKKQFLTSEQIDSRQQQSLTTNPALFQDSMSQLNTGM